MLTLASTRIEREMMTTLRFLPRAQLPPIQALKLALRPLALGQPRAQAQGQPRRLAQARAPEARVRGEQAREAALRLPEEGFNPFCPCLV